MRPRPRRCTRPHACWWLALLLSVAVSGCTSVFLHPTRVDYFPERSLGTPSEDVWITADDGSRLHALYLPAPGTARATLLFLHGNAENLSSHIHVVRWLPAHGYNVLALDYRGFGRSEGKTGIDAVHEDAAAALSWWVAQGPARHAPLIVYGQSLGGSVALRLVAEADAATRAQIVAVIADSAFASYRGIAREKLSQLWLTWPLQWPLSWLISERYAAIDRVDRIHPIPLLLIHGDDDVVVDANHARRLFAAARAPKQLWLIPEGSHIDATFRAPVRERLLDYLGAVSAPASTP